MIKTIGGAVAGFVLGSALMLGAPGLAASSHPAGHIQVQVRQHTETIGDDGPLVCATWERHKWSSSATWSGWELKLWKRGVCF